MKSEEGGGGSGSIEGGGGDGGASVVGGGGDASVGDYGVALDVVD